MAEYKLSATLKGHDDDVRAVVFPSSKIVITGSRDGTVRAWERTSDQPPSFEDTLTSTGTGYVQTVAYIPPDPRYPDGLVVSGGQDSIIEVRRPAAGPQESAEALLLGHERNICALDIDPAGAFIVSGSWDMRARIWPIGKWECDVVLGEHEGSVWAVLVYNADTIITGCADKKIRVFRRSGKLIRTINGSEDPVRALCRLPKGHASGADFASAGNDMVLRLWTIDGREVAALTGHESFIYSIDVSSNGDLFTSGEDRTLRIWRGNTCQQIITHPAVSIWSVAVCPETGDVVTGASDRIARVFSREASRHASTEALANFDTMIRESAIPQQALDQKINKEKLPGPEFLKQQSGTKEGQVQMIAQPNGAVTAHMWSGGQWMDVGTVVDAAGSSGKKVEFTGQEYDYVFDVDIEDGKPPLKLPYNLSQNPYEAATKFIADNELPMTYLDQVANFITTNTQGPTIGQTASTSTPDPWGSDARYRPGDASNTTESSRPPPTAKLLPQKTYLSIMNTALPKLVSKIQELNTAFLAAGQKDVSLNPTELEALNKMQDFLSKHVASTTTSSSATAPVDGIALAYKISTRWPYASRLPGLDLLRLLASTSSFASHSTAGYGTIVDQLLTSVNSESPPQKNHAMMLIRLFANLFTTQPGRDLTLHAREPILNFIDTTLSTVGQGDRNVGVAAATVWINYAVLLSSAAKSTANSDAQTSSMPLQGEEHFNLSLRILEAAKRILDSATSTNVDAEVLFRSLVAVGTTMHAATSAASEIKTAAKDVLGLPATLDALRRDTKSEKRIRDLAEEVAVLLR